MALFPVRKDRQMRKEFRLRFSGNKLSFANSVWERTFAKLRFAGKNRSKLRFLPEPKQSFGGMHSQTGVWERGENEEGVPLAVQPGPFRGLIRSLNPSGLIYS